MLLVYGAWYLFCFVNHLELHTIYKYYIYINLYNIPSYHYTERGKTQSNKTPSTHSLIDAFFVPHIMNPTRNVQTTAAPTARSFNSSNLHAPIGGFGGSKLSILLIYCLVRARVSDTCLWGWYIVIGRNARFAHRIDRLFNKPKQRMTEPRRVAL